MIYSDQLNKLIKALSSLPGIGPRHASRLGFYLVNTNRGRLNDLDQAIMAVKSLTTCPRCFFISEGGPNSLCSICQDPNRNHKVIAIVAKETDLISLEKMGQYKGDYLIIGDLRRNGLLDEEHNRRLNVLKQRLKDELKAPADEIIIAISPTSLGDATADILKQLLSPYATTITRLGRGLPTGGEIEFADDATLSASLKNRH